MERALFIKLCLGLAATETCLSGCGNGSDDDAGGAGGNGGGPAGSGGGAGSPSGGTAGSAGPSQCQSDAMLVQTSTESHDHLPLTVPISAAQLNQDMTLEYALPLEQNHRHTLSFTVQDLVALRSGMALSKVSSNDSGHTHTYAVTCL